MNRAVAVAWLLAATGHAAPPNLHHAAEGVWVGGAPASESDWRALADLGVRSAVGVDGLPPDASKAARVGVRVIHVPIGYGGVSKVASAQLARIAAEAERPLYVYCHHGKHRGPAATAILCRSAGLMDREAGCRLLVRCGTDPKFVGLWRAVEDFRPPPPEASPQHLQEASPVPPLRLAMSQLDQAWDQATGAAEDATRRQAIVLALEAMRESRRAAGAGRAGDNLLRRFDESLRPLQQLAAGKPTIDFETTAVAVSASCLSCHTEHRDQID